MRSIHLLRAADIQPDPAHNYLQGSGPTAVETKAAVPKSLDRVNSHRIRISHESFEEDRPNDPISAVMPDKPSVPVRKRVQALIAF